jgi:hypothetical protein
MNRNDHEENQEKNENNNVSALTDDDPFRYPMRRRRIDGHTFWNCGIVHFEGPDKRSLQVIFGHNHSTKWEALNCVNLHDIIQELCIGGRR